MSCFFPAGPTRWNIVLSHRSFRLRQLTFSAMTPEPSTPSGDPRSAEPPSFRRVYQACENCRQKKHKCNLGGSINPSPPCLACRRANLPCGESIAQIYTFIPSLLTLQCSQNEKGRAVLRREHRSVSPHTKQTRRCCQAILPSRRRRQALPVVPARLLGSLTWGHVILCWAQVTTLPNGRPV